MVSNNVMETLFLNYLQPPTDQLTHRLKLADNIGCIYQSGFNTACASWVLNSMCITQIIQSFIYYN